MDVEVGGRAKTLDQRDGAAVANASLEPGMVQQVPRDHALHHLQHRRDQLGLRGQQQPLRDGVPGTICLGKLSGSKTAFPTVSNADGPGANPLPLRPRENTSTPTAVANHKKLAQHRPSSIPHWLSQPG